MSTPKVRIFLESRYRKLVRDLPQTVFYCPTCKGDRRKKRTCDHCGGYGKLTKDSVEELIARRVLPAFRAKYGKFHGAGREDLDVLMLGDGRPFVYEVVQPRNQDVDLETIVDRLHDEEGDRVRIDPFVRVERGRVAEVKNAEADKRYRLEAELGGEGNAEPLVGRRVEVVQRTPQRVAHRRADLERHKVVTIETARSLGPTRLELEIHCTHGTYVKEWVSGDDGRTEPSLAGLLGVSARCAVLDVLAVGQLGTKSE